jgi:hypothetical protein
MKRILTLVVALLVIPTVPSVSEADGSVGSLTMAVDNGVVRSESKDLAITATKATYDVESGDLKLEGSAKMPVTLRKAGQILSARALNISLKTGKTIARGIERLDARP